MAFAFMDIQKIKSEGQMNSKYKHNCRKIDIDNVISEYSDRNEDLVPLPQEDGEELNYYEAFKKRIDNLPYYQDHKIRSNAVLGYEVILTFSRDENIDIEEWKKRSVQWLKDTFDVAPDGQSNVLHVIYHGDETGNVHCHALVTPVDENGKLNAKRFTNGSRAMSGLQTSYAEAVSDLGLERGLAGSSAKHKEIRKMYAELNRALVIPEVNPEETADQYRDRVMEDIKTAYAASKKHIDDLKAARRRLNDEKNIRERDAIQNELEKTRIVAQREISELNEQRKELRKGVITYEEMLADLNQQMEELKAEMKGKKNISEKVEFYDKFQEGMQAISYVTPDAVRLIQEDVDYVMRAAEEYEERKELYETNEEDIIY